MGKKQDGRNVFLDIGWDVNVNIVIIRQRHLCVLFSESFRSGTRSELIVTFLAMLELIKLKLVAVKQQRLFAEIYISILMPEGNDNPN